MAKYLPAFDEIEVQQNGREVAVVRLPTVCSLLTHTSGLSCDYLEDFPVAEQYRQVGICANASRTLEQMIAELARLPLAYQPGTRWYYGLGIDVTVHIAEVVAGISMYGTRIIGRKTLELMHSNHLPLDLRPLINNGLANSGYGFGLESRVLLDVAATELLESVGEYGWVGAAQTYYCIDPHEEIISLIMAQKKGIDAP